MSREKSLAKPLIKPLIWKEFKTANPKTARALKVAAVSTGAGITKGIKVREKEAKKIDKKTNLQKREKQNSTNEDIPIIASASNETEILEIELNFEEIQIIKENIKNEVVNKLIVNKPNSLKI